MWGVCVCGAKGKGRGHGRQCGVVCRCVCAVAGVVCRQVGKGVVVGEERCAGTGVCKGVVVGRCGREAKCREAGR